MSRLLFSLLFAMLLQLVLCSDTNGTHEMTIMSIDLNEFENNASNASALEKRKDVKLCGYTFKVTTTRCTSWGGLGISIGAFAVSAASSFKGSSNSNDCGIEEYTLNNFDYAIAATGRNCDTTAQRATIEGAIEKYLRQNNPSSFCNVQCYHLTHGGTWNGYLVFGAANYDLNYYATQCEALTKSGTCVSGGSGDVSKRGEPMHKVW